MAKMCKWCKKHPAVVPINRGTGRFIKQICKYCHANRLKGDLVQIIKSEKEKSEDGSTD